MATPPDAESADEFISVARFDWLVSKAWNRLHAVRDEDWTTEHRADMEYEWGVSHPVRLACRRVAAAVWIPGVGSRLGAPRCKGCCRALGYPQGVGSPKNDDVCRALLGLAVEAATVLRGRAVVFPQARVRLECSGPAFGFGLLDDPRAADLLGFEVAAADLALNGVARGLGHGGYLRGAQHGIRITRVALCRASVYGCAMKSNHKEAQGR